MALQDVILPKKYKNSKVLFEQNLDAWRLAAEQAFQTVNNNFTQLRKDLFLSTYNYNNNGTQTVSPSLQEQINLIASGGTPIAGTTADTFTINTDGNSATLSAGSLSDDRTYLFPDESGTFVLTAATQTLTNKSISAGQINSGTFADARIAQSNVTQHQAALVLAASQTTSGTFADARISQSSVTQHQAALAIAASQVTSGTFADARIAQSNVTQHQAALVLAASQITSGTLLTARGGTNHGDYTQGAIIFAGASGTILDQAPTQLVWDNAQSFAGFGTNSPNCRGHFSGTGAGARVRIENTGAGIAALRLENTGREWSIENQSTGGFGIVDQDGSGLTKLSIVEDGSEFRVNVAGSDSSLKRTKTGAVTTTNNTPTTLMTISTDTDTVINLRIMVVAKHTTNPSEYGCFFRYYCFTNDSGVLTKIAAGTGVDGSYSDSMGTGETSGLGLGISALTVDASGTDIVVQVTGDTAETWDWDGFMDYTIA